MSKDRKPNVFDYIRLMQPMPLCANRFECVLNQETPLIDAYDIPDLRHGDIEVADNRASERIKKLLDKYVTCPPKPSQEATECELSLYNEYRETCNSLRWLYNQFCGEAQDYRQKYSLICGTEHKCGRYGNIADYYRDVRKCYNIILNQECRGIGLSVRAGLITSVKLQNRHKQPKVIPTFGGDLAESEFKTLSVWIDPDGRFESTKKMTLSYSQDDAHLYTFHELLDNIGAYLAEVVKGELLGSSNKNATRATFYRRLNGLFQYVYDNELISFPGSRRKDEAIDFVLQLLGFDVDDPCVDVNVLYGYVGATRDKTIVLSCGEKLDPAALSWIEKSLGNEELK